MKRIAAFAVGLSFGSSALAAGFLDHKNGTPYRWKVFPIVYKVDPGPLATKPPNATAIDNAAGRLLIQNAFQHWKDVPIAQVDFLACADKPSCTDLSTDITAANVDSYVTFDASGAPRSVTPDTVVVFDPDGSIVDHFLGSGQSSKVLGLASAGALVDSDMSITSGIAILNGKFGSSLQLEATITHELGHMLNLQHSQLNQAEAFDSDPADDNVVPTMFPYLPDDETTTLTPKADDRFSLAYLYPSAAYAARGKVIGKIVRRNGDGVRGVNVICRNAADSRADAVSWVSDQVLAGKGEYECGNLNAGNYTVFIEPMTLALNVYTPDPPFIVKEHYSGSKESFDPDVDLKAVDTADDPGGATGSETISTVAVTAGTATPDIDIVLNEDGRLISGTAVSASSSAFFPPLEYFITVPPGTRSATFELSTPSTTADLDILGRCTDEFSLPIDSVALPLVSSTGGLQQAEFFTNSPSGNEKVVLDDSSTPPIKGCTYHLLVVNYSATTSASPTDFTFKATLQGDPELKFTELFRRDTAGSAGDTEMLVQKVTAVNENFELRSLVFTDDGVADFSAIQKGRLYLDADGDGRLSGGDTLLADSDSVDTSSRKISFKGFDVSVDAGKSKTLILVYTFAAKAGGIPGWIVWALLPAAWMAFRRSRRGALAAFAFLLIGVGSCSQKLDYDPFFRSDADVGAQGLAYGTNFKISRGARITNCTLVAPQLHPTGSGEILPRCLPN